MASIYTDAEREARYSRLLRKKKRCELVLGIAMFGTLLLAVLEIIPHAFEGLLYGLFIGDLDPFFIFLAVTAFFGFAIFALYKRKLLLTAAALVCSMLMIPFFELFGFGILSSVLLLAALAATVFWHQLEQEEGFPQFTISYQERAERQKAQEKHARRRAVESGTHIEEPVLHAQADMSDLLDAETDKPALSAVLRNYHERSRNASAAVQVPEPHSESMDEL